MSQDHSAETAVHVQDQTAGEPSSAAPSPAALDTDAPVEEAAASVVSDSKPAAKPIGGFMAGLLGGAAVTLVALATVTVAWPLVRDQLLGADGNRLSLLERQSDELSQKVALLQGQVSNQSEGAGATLSNSLNQRLTSLEQRLSSADEDPRLSSLSQKMDQTTADNAHLRDEMGQLRNSIPPEGLILRLAERAESAEKAARDISSQHAQAQALLLVVGQLRDAIDRGDPYDFELHAARRVAPPEEAPQLDALDVSATTGLPRRAALLNSLPLMVPAILRAGLVQENGSLWQRALNRLASLVVVRRIDGTGNDTASVLARAQSAVRDGDLNKAILELSTLSGASAEKAAPWIKDAQARVAVDRALSMLAADAMAISAKAN